MLGIWNNLLQRTEQAYQSPINEIIEEKIDEEPTKLTSVVLNKIIENFQYASDFASGNDPFEERSSKIIKDIKGCLFSETFFTLVVSSTNVRNHHSDNFHNRLKS